MSPELETLDQLLAGELPISAIRDFFKDDECFIRGITSMLGSGEIRLLDDDGHDVPRWQ